MIPTGAPQSDSRARIRRPGLPGRRAPNEIHLNPPDAETTTPARTSSSNTASCGSRSTNSDFAERCEQAAIKLGFVGGRLGEEELEDLVNLAVNGEIF